MEIDRLFFKNNRSFLKIDRLFFLKRLLVFPKTTAHF